MASTVVSVADIAAAGQRKGRRRRRRADKPAISARLVLDDHVKSDVGILSEDLFADLFPQLQDRLWPHGQCSALNMCTC
jgi:peroxin-6